MLTGNEPKGARVRLVKMPHQGHRVGEIFSVRTFNDIGGDTYVYVNTLDGKESRMGGCFLWRFERADLEWDE